MIEDKLKKEIKGIPPKTKTWYCLKCDKEIIPRAICKCAKQIPTGESVIETKLIEEFKEWWYGDTRTYIQAKHWLKSAFKQVRKDEKRKFLSKDHIYMPDGTEAVIIKSLTKQMNKQCFCQSYYDNDNVLQDCTCGKCKQEKKK